MRKNSAMPMQSLPIFYLKFGFCTLLFFTLPTVHAKSSTSDSLALASPSRKAEDNQLTHWDFSKTYSDNARSSWRNLAQVDADDSYDPFADYSEFDYASEEEADIYFFRHGRFVTIGLTLGQRFFTDGMMAVYQAAPTYGLFLTFFFDLRLALQMGALVSDHNFEIPMDNGVPVRGTMGLSMLQVNIKYFLNTQNMTRTIAELNPYLLGGPEQVARTYSSQTTAGVVTGQDTVYGINLGAGIEIPFNRRRAFVGFQGQYHYYNFPDENSLLVDPSNAAVRATRLVNGDSWDILAILGINF